MAQGRGVASLADLKKRWHVLAGGLPKVEHGAAAAAAASKGRAKVTGAAPFPTEAALFLPRLLPPCHPFLSRCRPPGLPFFHLCSRSCRCISGRDCRGSGFKQAQPGSLEGGRPSWPAQGQPQTSCTQVQRSTGEAREGVCAAAQAGRCSKNYLSERANCCCRTFLSPPLLPDC